MPLVGSLKSQKHQKWLMLLNQNKANYYVESIKNKEVLESQKKIIARLENQLQTKSMTIDYLTKQLSDNNKQTDRSVNLIDL
jgi:hypothetical protein